MFAVPIHDGTTVILNHSPQGGSRHFACLVEKAGEPWTAGPPQYSLIVEPWGNGMAYRLTIERTGQSERESTYSSSTSMSTLSRSPSVVNATPPPCQRNVPTFIQGPRKDWTQEEKPTFNPTVADSPSQDSMDWINRPNHPPYAFLNQLGGQNTAFSREAFVANPHASAVNFGLLEPLFWNESDLMPRLNTHHNDDPISPTEATAISLHARTPINNYNDFMDVNMLTFPEQDHDTDANDCSSNKQLSPVGGNSAYPSPGSSDGHGGRVKRVYPCREPGCRGVFSRVYTRRVHEKKHSEEQIKRRQCRFPNCHVQVSRPHDRLRHEVTTHNIVAEWTCICSAFFLTQSGLNTHQKSCQKWQCRESFVKTVDDKERQSSGPLSRWIRGHGNGMANDNQSKETDSRNKSQPPI